MAEDVAGCRVQGAGCRVQGAGCRVQRWSYAGCGYYRGVGVRCADVQSDVQRWRGGAEVVQRCRGADVQRWRGAGAEVERCEGDAEVMQR